jgi:hypothetical protein
MSFPVLRDGEKVPIEEHKTGIKGAVFGKSRIVYNSEKRGRELLENDGSYIRDLSFNETYRNIVNLKISAKNGLHFVSNNVLKTDFIISTRDGLDIGRVKWKHKASWNTYPVNNLLLVGPDGRFYRVFTGQDGIYVYRWFM